MNRFRHLLRERPNGSASSRLCDIVYLFLTWAGNASLVSAHGVFRHCTRQTFLVEAQFVREPSFDYMHNRAHSGYFPNPGKVRVSLYAPRATGKGMSSGRAIVRHL
jgi:hypothetical protein